MGRSRMCLYWRWMRLISSDLFEIGPYSQGVFVGSCWQTAGVDFVIPLLASDAEIEYSS